jgi:SPX domain protein involved in polyphosphate accumulation
MKFGKYLRANLTPEWSSQFIGYDELKDVLTAAIEKAQSLPNSKDTATRDEIYRLADEEFFRVRMIHCTIRFATFLWSL